MKNVYYNTWRHGGEWWPLYPPPVRVNIVLIYTEWIFMSYNFMDEMSPIPPFWERLPLVETSRSHFDRTDVDDLPASQDEMSGPHHLAVSLLPPMVVVVFTTLDAMVRGGDL